MQGVRHKAQGERLEVGGQRTDCEFRIANFEFGIRELGN